MLCSKPVWMTEWLRKVIGNRHKIFKKDGRKKRWPGYKEKIKKIVKERKSKANEHIRSKFMNEKDSKNFFKSLKCLLEQNEPSRWDVRSLYPDLDDKGVAEKLVQFFNGISSEDKAITPADIPPSHPRSLPKIQESEVLSRISKARKTSAVPGDLDKRIYDVYLLQFSERCPVSVNIV